uniref:Uncharacterized protein n=1 Tax=Oncorhynchus mykiss TaxID=8022 RepID=A0A8K9WVG6_ONCMY
MHWMYCHSLMGIMRKCSGTGVEFEGYRASVLAVAKAKSPSPALTQDLSLPSGLYSRVPNLGLVLARQALGKLQCLEQPPPEELKEETHIQPIDKRISLVQRSLLVQLINNRAKLLTCLFVLWRHLEFDLLYCTPTDPKDSLMPGASEVLPRLTLLYRGSCRVTWGQALQRKLQEVEGLNSQVRSHSTFIQALVRRIQGLFHQPKS